MDGQMDEWTDGWMDRYEEGDFWQELAHMIMEYEKYHMVCHL